MTPTAAIASPIHPFFENADVFERVVVYATEAEAPYGPPITIHRLSATCKLFASLMTAMREGGLDSKLFAMSFELRVTFRDFVRVTQTEFNLNDLWLAVYRLRTVAVGQLHVQPLLDLDWLIAYHLMRFSTTPFCKVFRQLTIYARINEATWRLLQTSNVNFGKETTDDSVRNMEYAMYLWYMSATRENIISRQSIITNQVRSLFEHYTFISRPMLKMTETETYTAEASLNTTMPIWCLIMLLSQYHLQPPGINTAQGLEDDWGPTEIDYAEFNRIAQWSSFAGLSTGLLRHLYEENPTISSFNVPAGLWAGRVVLHCPIESFEGGDHPFSPSNLRNALVIQKPLIWRIEGQGTDNPIASLDPKCETCGAGLREVECSCAIKGWIIGKHQNEGWPLISGTTDHRHCKAWVPRGLPRPTYLGVVNPDNGLLTFLNDSGAQGTLVYEGRIMVVGWGKHAVYQYVGRCTNGDGSINGAFGVSLTG